MSKLAPPFCFAVTGFASLAFVVWASQFVQANYSRQPHLLWTPGLLESVCLASLLLGLLGVRRAWAIRRQSLAWLAVIFCILCCIAAVVSVVAVVPIYAHPPRP